MTNQIAAYGAWKSPITLDLVAAGAVGLGHVALDGGAIYWVEQRSQEAGRNVIVRWTPDGQTTDTTPPPFNARTRVHEYGGGAFAVHHGVIFFSNFADQRVYRQDPGAPPRAITPAKDLRYADGVVDARRRRMICVREDHTGAGEAINTLVSLDLDGKDDGGTVLVAGNDFYSSPRLSPAGTQVAWLTWNHPNMPWDGTELWLGEVNADGTLGRSERIAGGVTESIVQPEWSPDGVLHFISDKTGWWNLYRWRAGRIEPLSAMSAEFGLPSWNLGGSVYGFTSPREIICMYGERGANQLARLDPDTRTLEPFALPYSDIFRVQVAAKTVVLIVGSPTTPSSVVKLDLATSQPQVLRRTHDVSVDPAYLSTPRAIEFPNEQGLPVYAFFYPPRNRDFAAPADQKPPLIVISHGGPTSSTTTTFNLGIQYWTSRGFGVVDVNYGGSTGYGRAYRQRLNGQWGVVDVNDCASAARYLAARGQVDGKRLIIRGGSAGGYTTLAALTFTQVFHAGASYFGISDLEAMAQDTHKFESRYLDTLIGPYPARRDLYVARSPIHFTDQIACPMILFQGLEDKVVPPNQAETIVHALRAKGLPVAYLPFAGEQHGFRKAETIKRTLEAELYFYSRVLGFELAEPVTPVPIENL